MKKLSLVGLALFSAFAVAACDMGPGEESDAGEGSDSDETFGQVEQPLCLYSTISPPAADATFLWPGGANGASLTKNSPSGGYGNAQCDA